jgi:pimeloyl-ACP methyl ester carboxylesterase
MNVYFIGGLGSDKRIFRHIQLPADCEIIYLDWIPPEKNESLPAYALRLAAIIQFQEPFILVGLSFGGMIAVEIAKVYRPQKIILISSIPVSRHLPAYYRMASSIRLQRILPISIIKWAALLKRRFSRETSEDKKILKEMILSSDASFIKWAFGAILSWKNKWVPENLIHIHGSRDRILPYRYTQPTHIINKAGHIMILTQSEEINKILEQVLEA